MEDCNLETSLQRLTSLQHQVIYSWPWGQVGGGGAGTGFHTDTLWWRNKPLPDQLSLSPRTASPGIYCPSTEQEHQERYLLSSLTPAGPMGTPWPWSSDTAFTGPWEMEQVTTPTAHLIAKMSFNVDHQNRLLPTPILPCSLAIRHWYVAEVQLSTASIFY